MGLINDISLSGMVQRIVAVVPPIFTSDAGSAFINFMNGISSGFCVIANQIQELYDRTFIASATGQALNDIIGDLTRIRRINDETDEDYKTRYYKYVFDYNCTEDSINEIVYDVTNAYPRKLLELNARSAFWASGNVQESTGTSFFYDDVGSYACYWGDDYNVKTFTGYIYLYERPPVDILNELLDVLNMVRPRGVQYYLIFPDVASIYDRGYKYDNEEIYG